MSYDPFARGPLPVGVRTLLAADSARGQRSLPIEVWYPATDEHAGRDLELETQDRYELLPGFPSATQQAARDAAPRAGRYPLVAFSHGFGGHRRQTTFLCTHLASHGYVVAAVDHTGNTAVDVMQAMLGIQSDMPPTDPMAALTTFIDIRPRDIEFMIAQVAAAPPFSAQIDVERIGMTGHSFGGWTTLAYTARDRRVRAALPLAPAGGKSALPTEALGAALRFDWGREVPTLYLVADRDSILPLASMYELFERTRGPKKMVVLQQADHMHFCDRVEEVHELFRMMPPPGAEAMAATIAPISELCPGEHAYLLIRGLGLAHMDAHLKNNESAAQLLQRDLVKLMAERGVTVSAY